MRTEVDIVKAEISCDAEEYGCNDVRIIGQNSKCDVSWFDFTVNNNELVLDDTNIWGNYSKQVCRDGVDAINEKLGFLKNCQPYCVIKISNTRFAIIIPNSAYIEVEMEYYISWDELEVFANNQFSEVIFSLLNYYDSKKPEKNKPSSTSKVEAHAKTRISKFNSEFGESTVYTLINSSNEEELIKKSKELNILLDISKIAGLPNLSFLYKFKDGNNVVIKISSDAEILGIFTLKMKNKDKDSVSVADYEIKRFKTFIQLLGLYFDESLDSDEESTSGNIFNNENFNSICEIVNEVFKGNKKISMSFCGTEEFKVTYDDVEKTIYFEDIVSKLKKLEDKIKLWF